MSVCIFLNLFCLHCLLNAGIGKIQFPANKISLAEAVRLHRTKIAIQSFLLLSR